MDGTIYFMKNGVIFCWKNSFSSVIPLFLLNEKKNCPPKLFVAKMSRKMLGCLSCFLTLIPLLFSHVASTLNSRFSVFFLFIHNNFQCCWLSMSSWLDSALARSEKYSKYFFFPRYLVVFLTFCLLCRFLLIIQRYKKEDLSPFPTVVTILMKEWMCYKIVIFSALT